MKNKRLLAIFLVVFVDLLGFGIILPLLPFIAERYRANAAEIGFLTATYSFFQLIAAPILGRLSDRYGRKKLLVFSQFGSTVGYLLLGFATNIPLLFASRIIDGITGGNISIAQAYIADVTTKENRAKGMGIIGAAFGLGFIFGPAIGGFLAQYGYMYPAMFAAFVSLITVLSTIFFLPETVRVQEALQKKHTAFSVKEFKRVLFDKNIGYLIIVFFLLNTAFSVLQGNFALWTQARFGFGPSENGFYFAYIGILSVIFQLKILPVLVKRFREANLLRYATLFLFAGLFFMPLIPVPSFLLVTQFFIVLGNSMANPSIQALASEHVPKEEYGETLGILQSSGGLGRILGPILGGEIFLHLGEDTPFFVASAIMFAVFLYVRKQLQNN